MKLTNKERKLVKEYAKKLVGKRLNENKVLNTIEEVEEFLNDYHQEIMSQISGHSDGWNQKMTALHKILKREKVDFDEDIWNSEEFEDLFSTL